MASQFVLANSQTPGLAFFINEGRTGLNHVGVNKLPDVVHPLVRHQALANLHHLGLHIGRAGWMLPGVMSGSLYSRIVAVHDAIARSGGLPVMDRFFVPNDPTFQYHVYELKSYMVRIVHPYLFGKKERFEHFAAWRDTSAYMREEHAWVQECISAVDDVFDNIGDIIRCINAAKAAMPTTRRGPRPNAYYIVPGVAPVAPVVIDVD